MVSGYKDAALQYVAHGWLGVLPVPPGRKDPVPTGHSGYDGIYPDKEKINFWRANGFDAKVEKVYGHYSSEDANIALRLPNTVVGIDVDAYDGKKGRETLAHAEELWGELPPTLRSSSRIDGISGIRLYRVPPGTHLHTGVAFPELGLSGIDVIQYWHRFCIAWPSVHPTTKRVYRWLNGEGMVTTELPRVGSIPNLPDKWVEELSRPPEAEITVQADIAEVMSELDYTTPTQRVQDCLNRACREIEDSTGGRHDETMRNIGRLLRLHHEEETGVGSALGTLHDFFVAAVVTDGSRSESMAESEWSRMLLGNRIHDKIASTPSRNKALEAVLGQKIPSLEAVMSTTSVAPDYRGTTPEDQRLYEFKYGGQINRYEDTQHYHLPAQPVYPPGVSEVSSGVVSVEPELDDGMADIFGSVWEKSPPKGKPDQDQLLQPVVEPDDGMDMFDRILLGEEGSSSSLARTSWGPADLTDILESDDFEPEPATVGFRGDGACLFYPGKVNTLVGPPESGKGWVASHIAQQELRGSRSVLYLDFEDTKRGVVGRFRFLGVDRETIAERLLYAAPKRALDQDSAAELFSTIDIHKPSLIIVDGLGAVMAMHNHEMKDNTEFTKFNQLLLSPLADTGACVVVIDHTAKNTDESNNYAIGAQSKLAMLDGAQIRVQAVKKFGRGREGKLLLWINKDRHGGVRENAEPRGKFQLDYWATVFVDARDTPNVRIDLRFESKEDQDAPNGQGHLHLMTDRVIEFLLANDPDKKGVAKGALMQGVHGKNEAITSAINELELNRTVSVEKSGRALLVTLLREPEEPGADLKLILGGATDEPV